MQTAFLVPINGKLKCFLFEDILFISAKDKYCEFVTIDQKKWLVRIAISQVDKQLPENLFVRVHRSHIISLHKIDWLECDVVTIGAHKLDVSKDGYEAITERVLILCPEFDKKLKDEMKGLSPEDYVKRVKRRKRRFE
ncbi:MAG TPA: LytTR family DNA-binding domain-containing protein [Flavisolibacter sp.]|jgi:DNA-binding LytR/AlgR family response regulator|nr:LytTR family DNA-binding domain-containing protein [Flavisolibacter sp.]